MLNPNNGVIKNVSINISRCSRNESRESFDDDDYERIEVITLSKDFSNSNLHQFVKKNKIRNNA